jgi:membrane protein required for beta-lactamase induction
VILGGKENAMERRCSGTGLMLAGAIVALVGLLIAISVTFGVPRHWMVFMIGVALLGAGAVRRRLGPSRGERPDTGAGKA